MKNVKDTKALLTYTGPDGLFIAGATWKNSKKIAIGGWHFTVKQARRIAMWILARCDEIDAESNPEQKKENMTNPQNKLDNS